MVVVLKGKRVELSYEDLRKILEKEIIGDRKTKYYAVIEGKRVPVKRFLYEVLKSKGYEFTLQDFTTKDAVRILKHFGVRVEEAGEKEKEKTHEERSKKTEILKFAGVLSIGGNAVEDEEKLYSP